MKKIELKKRWLLILPIVCSSLLACNKEPKIDKEGIPVEKDSSKAEDTLSRIISKEIESNQIIVSVDASVLPVRLREEIKNPEEQMVIRLLNYNKAELRASVSPDQPMNLRINQIRLPDNTFDGPFNESITYRTPLVGEYWLVLSKNNRASGNAVGTFFLKVE